MDEAKPILLRISGVQEPDESTSLLRYVNPLTSSTWCPDMTQEGGEGPKATFLVFAQDVWRSTMLAAASNDSRMDVH